MASRLPLELCSEFVSYLWDDKKALSACSLAGRALTVASQKQLFYQIILHQAQEDFGGTSSAFHRLLESSPHIAKYVKCLQIFDIHEDDSDSESSSDSGHWPNDLWLPQDPFVPKFLYLLCNLKAFVLFYLPDWACLSEPVRRSLQDLLRLPSLVYIDIAPHPSILFKEYFGNNLKHLVLRDEDRFYKALVLPEPPRSPPIYLESLFAAKAEPTFLTHLTSDPDFRFKTSQLRKLVLDIQTDNTFQHFAIRPLLHSCRQTLEEFTFMPCVEFLSAADISAPKFTSIDLSEMTALKTLTLYFERVPSLAAVASDWDPLWCFNNLLRSASSTCPQLEDITVVMELYGRGFAVTNPPHISYWNEACQVLLDPSRCPRLRKLAIHSIDSDNAPAFLALLDDSESMRKLRARSGMEVSTMVKDRNDVDIWILQVTPDRRWENVAFCMI